jgi:hypothetical protein
MRFEVIAEFKKRVESLYSVKAPEGMRVPRGGKASECGPLFSAESRF